MYTKHFFFINNDEEKLTQWEILKISIEKCNKTIMSVWCMHLTDTDLSHWPWSMSLLNVP